MTKLRTELEGESDEKVLESASPAELPQDPPTQASARLPQSRLVIFAIGQSVLWAAHVGLCGRFRLNAVRWYTGNILHSPIHPARLPYHRSRRAMGFGILHAGLGEYEVSGKYHELTAGLRAAASWKTV